MTTTTTKEATMLRHSDITDLLDELVEDTRTAWHVTIDGGWSGARQFAWIEAAKRITPTCCPTQGDPGPSWGWVERGAVVGGTAAQCGGCGSIGRNWVTAGPVEIGDLEEITEEDVKATGRRLLAAVEEQWAAEAGLARHRLREELRKDLELARSADPDDLPQLDWMAEPGVGVDADGTLVAWDWDPADEDGTKLLEVRADEL